MFCGRCDISMLTELASLKASFCGKSPSAHGCFWPIEQTGNCCHCRVGLGGGCEVAMACDIRIAEGSNWDCRNAISVYFLVRRDETDCLVGNGWAKDMI